ncbi:MAG: DUF4373 domain-containing protein [Bacteroidia bacterium]|nr:DUF4373 domain-containing protein [Bacteroidia bacterium]
MARPPRKGCSYFSHDNDMRNDPKIKSLRVNHHITGYAVYVMFLEFLTGIEKNIFIESEIDYELLSGDFGVPAREIREILSFCDRIGLLKMEKGMVRCLGLEKRLAYVYAKRGVAKELLSQKPSEMQQKLSFSDSNAVSVTDSTQREGIILSYNTNTDFKVKRELEKNDLIPKPVFSYYQKTFEQLQHLGGGVAKGVDEADFELWKDFVELCATDYIEIFENTRFVFPSEFVKLVKQKGYTKDKWQENLGKILALGVPTGKEVILFHRIRDVLDFKINKINGAKSKTAEAVKQAGSKDKDFSKNKF